MPAGEGSVSGIVARTKASSSDNRGDVVHRMSLCAASNRSITLASSEAVNFSAWIRSPSYPSAGMSRRSSCPGAVFTSNRSRKCASVSFVTLRRSCPSWTSRFTTSNAVLASPTATASASSTCTSLRGAPSSAWIAASSTFWPPSTPAWSSSESASRAEPSACRAIACAAESSNITPSDAATFWSSSESPSIVCRRKSNRWQRPTIVAGILCGSVVARTKRTPAGGSSKTFSSASKASRDRRWASSMM